MNRPPPIINVSYVEPPQQLHRSFTVDIFYTRMRKPNSIRQNAKLDN